MNRYITYLLIAGLSLAISAQSSKAGDQPSAETAPAISAQSAKAGDQPSEETARAFMDAMEVRSVFQQTTGATDRVVSGALDRAVKKHDGKLTEEQRKVYHDMQAEMKSAYAEALNWKAIETEAVKIFGETFTQAEMEAILKFYGTPAGKALVEKTPVALNRTMQHIRNALMKVETHIREIEQQAHERADGLAGKK